MKEIRLHGRGGQGVVTAAELIAQAAFIDGKYAQAFPSFGSERMGAPVLSFVRISDNVIRSRNQIHNPDCLIIQDSTLLKSKELVTGLKPGGSIIIDTSRDAEAFGLDIEGEIFTIPASKMARAIIGRP
ncbi:MAG: 2-oxoacid:acceptor oxidoreductase family protein, partial [candidate division Zixibacteria bacterium]